MLLLMLKVALRLLLAVLKPSDQTSSSASTLLNFSKLRILSRSWKMQSFTWLRLPHMCSERRISNSQCMETKRSSLWYSSSLKCYWILWSMRTLDSKRRFQTWLLSVNSKMESLHTTKIFLRLRWQLTIAQRVCWVLRWQMWTTMQLFKSLVILWHLLIFYPVFARKVVPTVQDAKWMRAAHLLSIPSETLKSIRPTSISSAQLVKLSTKNSASNSLRKLRCWPSKSTIEFLSPL